MLLLTNFNSWFNENLSLNISSEGNEGFQLYLGLLALDLSGKHQ